mgnify:CR=1 FL=1
MTIKSCPSTIRQDCPPKIVRNATLKVYPGAPHGMCSTHKDQVNEDLLAFIKGEQAAVAWIARLPPVRFVCQTRKKQL